MEDIYICPKCGGANTENEYTTRWWCTGLFSDSFKDGFDIKKSRREVIMAGLPVSEDAGYFGIRCAQCDNEWVFHFKESLLP
jgi:hypothetical protein